MRDHAQKPLSEILDLYDAKAPLERASTIPAPWYTDPRIHDLERRTVFSRNWILAARADQVAEPGRFVTTEIAGEPIVVVRGDDGALRAFHNVCLHHAAAVVTDPEGSARSLRCPYHGWTYALDGRLKGTPEFAGVCDFDRDRQTLSPIAVDTWEGFVFVRLDPEGTPLRAYLSDLPGRFAPMSLAGLKFFERRTWRFECNWKVFVDNYLDGGYHIPFLHRGLDSVLDFGRYTIENGQRYCLQSSPMVADGAEPATGAVRRGERALYWWIHPNFMVNWYEGVMDTNIVIPLGVDRTEVVFDFWFPDVSDSAAQKNRASVEVAHRIQEEDLAICRSVQRGLSSRAYVAGRLSVRREAGEHLFHRLLAADLASGAGR